MRTLGALLAFLLLVSVIHAETVLIHQGGDEWREGELTDIPKNRVVRVIRLDPEQDVPTEPVPPDNQSLKSMVQAGAKALNEPQIAEILALGYGTMAGQIERGSNLSKAKIVEAQKRVNSTLLASSLQIPAWEGLLKKTWDFLEAEEASGKIVDPKDMIPYWRDIEAGLKESADATWQVQVTDDGPKMSGLRDRLDKDQWKRILEIIMMIILQIFGGGIGG